MSLNILLQNGAWGALPDGDGRATTNWTCLICCRRFGRMVYALEALHGLMTTVRKDCASTTGCHWREIVAAEARSRSERCETMAEMISVGKESMADIVE